MSQERRQDIENECPNNESSLIDVLESMSPQEQQEELDRVEEKGLLGYESENEENRIDEENLNNEESQESEEDENEFTENRPKLMRQLKCVVF